MTLHSYFTVPTFCIRTTSAIRQWECHRLAAFQERQSQMDNGERRSRQSHSPRREPRETFGSQRSRSLIANLAKSIRDPGIRDPRSGIRIRLAIRDQGLAIETLDQHEIVDGRLAPAKQNGAAVREAVSPHPCPLHRASIRSGNVRGCDRSLRGGAEHTRKLSPRDMAVNERVYRSRRSKRTMSDSSRVRSKMISRPSGDRSKSPMV